jgi:hypothetical protein
MLKERTAALEEGMRAIDVNVPCAPHGDIDVLALDRANGLTIIDFDTSSNDGLLLRGMSHFDWVVRNFPNVERMYRGQMIDYSRQPRLFLLAPQFSPLVRNVARHVRSPQIDWVRYHVVDVLYWTGILLEPVPHES